MDEKSTDSLNDVLGQVAYQINGSMTTMYAALRRLAPPDARDRDGEQDKNAALMAQCFFRLRRLAGNLEECASLEGAPLPPARNDDIVGIVRKVADWAAHPAEMLGLTLEFRSDRDSQIIAVNADRVERLVLNLLSNAFKFTPRGGSVGVELRTDERVVELRVTDTGHGMTARQQEEAFDRYRRSEMPTDLAQGMGLGLPICRKIAADHGGRVMLISKEGEGTTVVVTLENRRVNRLDMGSPVIFNYSGGFDRTLLELADALPKEAFLNKMTD